MAVTIDGTSGINTPGVVNTAAETIATTLAVTGVTTFAAGTAALPAITTTGDTNTGIFFPAADTIAFATAGTEAISIDSSGNLTIKDKIQFGTDAQVHIQAGGTSDVDLIVSADTNLRFETGTNERARIDSSGRMLINTTTPQARLTVLDAGDWVIASIRTGTGGEGHIRFDNANGNVGYIQTTGTTTQYVTSSDYRLKNTIAPMTGALAKVALLKPCTYKWNADGSDGQGFIAHELAEVVPGCVAGEKDEVDVDGNPKYQGIDTSFLVATLTAAIQEQQALITALTTRITALEAA